MSFKQNQIHPRSQQDNQIHQNSTRLWSSVDAISYPKNDLSLSDVHHSSSFVSNPRSTFSKPSVVKLQRGYLHNASIPMNQPILPSRSYPINSLPHYDDLLGKYHRGNVHRVDQNQSYSSVVRNHRGPKTKIPPKMNSVWPCLLLLFGLAMSAVVALTILFVQKENQPSSSSNSFRQLTCGDNCMMSITSYPIVTMATWLFENNLLDLNNIYDGTYQPLGTAATYIVGNINMAVVLDGTRYISVETHFLNLSYQSFTIEGWFQLTDLTSSSNRSILSQCSSTTTGQCLELSIRNKRLYFSFYNQNVMAATMLTAGTHWYHVAFVYDYNLMEQSIYLNGVLDGTTWGSSTVASPFKGTAVDTFIGRASSLSYFDGYIDSLQVSRGAKSACQILNDAILTAYYSFDRDIFNLDLSNNYINGYSNGLSTVSGRVGEAYLFQGTSSYFQSTAFTAYSTGESFSVALWVKPYSIYSGTLVHLSTGTTGGGTACFDLLGFSTTGQLIANLYDTYVCCGLPCPCHDSVSIGGPIMSINTWTHIVLTYSSSNGMALYTNGTLRAYNNGFLSFPSNIYASTSRPYMTVGSPTTTGSIPICLVASPILSPAPYQGLIDELRIYSRELTITEICSLFNP